MKKYICLILVLAMCLCFAVACGGNNDNNTTTTAGGNDPDVTTTAGKNEEEEEELPDSDPVVLDCQEDDRDEVIDKKQFEGDLTLRNVVIPEGIYTIDDEAFKNCTNMTDITFPPTLVDINLNAFAGCVNLRTITFQGNTRYIASSAFADCGKIRKVTFASAKIDKVTLQIDLGSFPKLTEVVLGDKITEIPSNMFKNCKALTGDRKSVV